MLWVCLLVIDVSDTEDIDDLDAAQYDSKIGTKKRRKLEEKEERKRQREVCIGANSSIYFID